ncbi:MAG: D-alanyl-D-alanine carboxypeptidase/D-alanyl-D-alanine endopeptidase [Planctomycetota bacterium]
MKRLLVAAVFSICLVGIASADLAARINAIISRPSQKKVQFSIHIVKADSGKTVYSHNAHNALVPASNMKIITTAAALKYLGPNYKYKTKVGLCGDTLVIIGSGDPLLGHKVTDAKHGRRVGWIFKDIVEVLKQNGIETVKDIIVDSSIFDDQRVHPNWLKKDLNQWYACEVAGLNYNGNCIAMTAKTVGNKVIVAIEPKTSFIKITNEVIPVQKAKHGIGAYRRPSKPNHLIVRGKCKKQEGPFDVAIERPAAFFGYLLTENLRKAGINAQGQLSEKAVSEDCNIRVLTEYTHSLADCLAQCNKISFGLAAEALLKTIAANSNPDSKGGSWAKGRQLISRYLLALGIKENQFYVDDASGLSTQNKLSANAVTRVLFSVYKSGNWKLYKDSLAVGGVDGTIKRHFKQEKYRGKVFGKTGYITGVKSFSGICSTAGGDYIFSVLANNCFGPKSYLTRVAINDMAKAIIDNE